MKTMHNEKSVLTTPASSFALLLFAHLKLPEKRKATNPDRANQRNEQECEVPTEHVASL